MNKKAWDGVLEPPIGGRTRKPRSTGITFLSAKGLGPAAIGDLVRVAADYVDRVKLAFGTTLLYDEDLLREKIGLFRAAAIDVSPGGTSLEIAIFQDKLSPFLTRAQDLGFTTIEVSDGTIRMDDATRERAVKLALEAGFDVVSEVGKKDPDQALSLDEVVRQVERDLRFGVSKVVIEARGSGRGIGMFDASGEVKAPDVEFLAARVDVERLIWEAPNQNGQEFFIKRFGSNVNLGNIRPDDIIPVEGLRQGLRGDTFRLVADPRYSRE